MNVRDGFENMTFNDAVKFLMNNKDSDRLETLNYLEFGLYYKAVLQYKENFNNVHILLYDDIIDNFSLEISKIFKFLDIRIDDKKNIHNIKYNISGIPRIKFLHNIMNSNFYLKNQLKQYLPKRAISFIKGLLEMNYKKPKINSYTKNRLINYYKNDIKNLEQVINRDLDLWLK